MPHALFLLADAGLPRVALTFPLMLILLIPVIVVEALLCEKRLGLSTWEAMKSNVLSNLAFTNSHHMFVCAAVIPIYNANIRGRTIMAVLPGVQRSRFLRQAR